MRLDVVGEREPHETENLIRRIAKESVARNLHRILVVLGLTGRLTTFEIHDIASQYREFGLGPEHKLTVVDKNHESREDQKFAEDVARTRGLNAAAFKDEVDALSWLLT